MRRTVGVCGKNQYWAPRDRWASNGCYCGVDKCGAGGCYCANWAKCVRVAYCGSCKGCLACAPNTRSAAGTKTPKSMCLALSGFYSSSGTPCPVGSSSVAGATTKSQCLALLGYYATGSSWKKCPDGTEPSPPGATMLSQCTAKPGFFNTGTEVLPCWNGTTTPVGATHISQCKAKPCYFRTGNDESGHPVFKACPPGATAPADARELAACKCKNGAYDSSKEVKEVSCTACTASCGAGKYLSQPCGPIDTFHGRDTGCALCPAHSSLQPTAKKLPPASDCKCGAEFFDDDDGPRVHCVQYPARLSSPANATCDVVGMQFGMKTGIGQMSTQEAMQLSKMLQYLGGIDSRKIPYADFNDLCVVLFAAFARNAAICGATFHLFGRVTAGKHGSYFGKASVKCKDHGSLAALLNMS